MPTSCNQHPYRPNSPNTAKLSSTLLQRNGVGLTFAEGVKSPPLSNPAVNRSPRAGGGIGEAPVCIQAAEQKMASADKNRRRRRSSSLMYQEPPESLEHMSDQSALPNLNSQWVNAKGEHKFFSLRMVKGRGG